jgi:3-hydroxyacyl-CoA dehydrogenase
MTIAIASAPSADYSQFAKKHYNLVVKDIESEAEESSENDGANNGKKKMAESVQEKKKRKRKEQKEKKRAEKKRQTELETEEWNGVDGSEDVKEMDEGMSSNFYLNFVY